MANVPATQRSMGYDHPAYLARLAFSSIMTAGSGGVSARFVAHANLLVFGLTTCTTILGTSTYTYSNGGTNTVAVAATQLSLIRVFNTASLGATIALSTQTFGPFTAGGQFVTAGTLTNQVGAYSQFQINTNTGTAGYGGVPVNLGDQLFIVNGTDATAVNLVQIDYQVLPGAGVIA